MLDIIIIVLLLFLLFIKCFRDNFVAGGCLLPWASSELWIPGTTFYQ